MHAIVTASCAVSNRESRYPPEKCGLVERKCEPWRLKSDFFRLVTSTNLVLSPEFIIETSLFIVAQLEFVMMNVPSASELAPSMTFERLVGHQDVAFVSCVTPRT